MQIVYKGKKPALNMKLAWLKEPFMIGRSTQLKPMPVEVHDDDALKLISEFPDTFAKYIPDPLEAFIRENGLDAEPEQVNPQAAAVTEEFDLDSVDFDFVDGAFVCPVCEKPYKENSGRGKAMLVNHLQEKHPEEWAEFLANKDSE